MVDHETVDALIDALNKRMKKKLDFESNAGFCIGVVYGSIFVSCLFVIFS